MTQPDPALAATRVRHELVRREVHVVSVEPVGANGLAVTFGGDSLAGFNSPGFDDHCKFFFTDAAGETQKRDFTPRKFDAATNQLVLEFALHEGGAASDWATRAKPGDTAMIGGPRGSVIFPTGYDWHLLAGDPTAAPAIARRVEELPATTRALVFLFDAAGSGGRELSSAAPVDVQWFTGEAAFLAALDATELPAGQGFIWCGGEADLMAQLRDLFVVRRQHPRAATRIAGYWKADEADFHETLERGVE